MATSFTSLPIVDLAPLSSPNPSSETLQSLSRQLHHVFETVGFAYLMNSPLTFSHDDVFGLTKEFFSIDHESKMKVAKNTFRKQNKNTYRGYFPTQPHLSSTNLKEGFELGPSLPLPPSAAPPRSPFLLTEPNIFPPSTHFLSRPKLERLYSEVLSLSTTLLDLLGNSLSLPPNTFPQLLHNSVSTLRLLHYPSAPSSTATPPSTSTTPCLSCSPHTDSGLLTLLHQDSTGGLEVLNSSDEWIAAPYVPGSIVVNIGDLMAQMSGGRFIATRHRVKSSGRERYSVPFFCEPGVDAVVGVGGVKGAEMRYGEWVVGKMGGWVEFSGGEAEEAGMGRGTMAREVEVGA